MAWQKILAEIEDENTPTVKKTSSLRGINNWIHGKIHTDRSQQTWSWTTIYKDNRRLVPKPDLRTVNKQDRKKIKQKYEETLNQYENYIHRIHLSLQISQQKFFVNDVEITRDIIELLKNLSDEQVKQLRNAQNL